MPLFYFSVGCGGETISFYVGWVFFLLVGGSGISGVPPSQVYINGTALRVNTTGNMYTDMSFVF